MIATRSSTRMPGSLGATTGIRQTRRRRRGGRTGTNGMRMSRESEWSLDAALKENASALTFMGIALGVFVSRKFFAIPVAVAAMLAQESLGKAGLARVRQVVRG